MTVRQWHFVPFLMMLSVLVVVSEIATAQLLPSQQCGWPAVYDGGHFGPATVRLAQYLLGNALHYAHVEANGVFSANTTAEIKAFQQMAGLAADGFLGPETWTALVKTAPLQAGDRNNAVFGLQASLSANGFPAALTGIFDAATVASLSIFEAARGDGVRNGSLVTGQSWHLLATGCNASGIFWFDAGWPQGAMSVGTLKCLKDQGSFEFATFECWVEAGDQGSFWPECVGNIANSWLAGYSAVGVYMFPQRYYDAALQAKWLLGNLSLHNVSYQAVMLDIEGSKWTQFPAEDNRQFMLALRSVFEGAGVNITVYCGDEWATFFGNNFTAFSDVPLIYAHYDNVPSYYDFFPSYGGWSQPAGKQFWDGSQGEVICGSGALDWDWSSKPFW